MFPSLHSYLFIYELNAGLFLKALANPNVSNRKNNEINESEQKLGCFGLGILAQL